MVYGMMDLSARKSSDGDHKNIEIKKCCTDCQTTKTPLWRGGPAGPKSLCNACGIRYRKKRRVMLGLHKDSNKKNGGTHMTTTCNAANGTSTTSSENSGNVSELRESLKMRLIVVGGKMMFQRSSIVKKQRCQRRRKLGEEEQAAFSLLALSCGSVFA